MSLPATLLQCLREEFHGPRPAEIYNEEVYNKRPANVRSFTCLRDLPLCIFRRRRKTWSCNHRHFVCPAISPGPFPGPQRSRL